MPDLQLFLVLGRDLPEGISLLIDNPNELPCTECVRNNEEATTQVWRCTGKGYSGTEARWLDNEEDGYFCEECLIVDDSCFVMAPDAKEALDLATRFVGCETEKEKVALKQRLYLGRTVYALSDEKWFQ